jgi:SAM-dependent methyltransferase
VSSSSGPATSPTWSHPGFPALDGVDGKLRSGAKVADIGCGLGASTILLAREYPNSAFSGSDYHDRSIEIARKRAGDAGTNSALTGNPLTVCEGCLAFFVTVSGQILAAAHTGRTRFVVRPHTMYPPGYGIARSCRSEVM